MAPIIAANLNEKKCAHPSKNLAFVAAGPSDDTHSGGCW
jgi:hypothetical protein